jgi:hypothetical protein
MSDTPTPDVPTETPAWATWEAVMKLGMLPVEFVQWASQREGGLPDGPIQMEDYERLKAEWEAEAGIGRQP